MDELKLILESVNGLADKGYNAFIMYLGYKAIVAICTALGISLAINTIFKGIKSLCRDGGR